MVASADSNASLFDWARLSYESAEAMERLSRAAQHLRSLAITSHGSPRKLYWQHGPVRLYRYDSPNQKRGARLIDSPPPVLIVFALINRPTILDLSSETSLIQKLLAQGRDVWLIDWGDPTLAEADWGVSTYVRELLPQAVAAMGVAQVDLLGVCQGGTLALLFNALHPECVRKLIVMISTVDFQTGDNLISRWVKTLDVEAMVQRHPLIPHDMIAMLFQALRPFRTQSDKLLYLLKHADDMPALAQYQAIEAWLANGPNHVGHAFKEYVSWFYQHNALIHNRVRLDGVAVDLSQIRSEVLGIYATEDHLVPLAGARALKQLLTHAAVAELELPTGHIGVYVSSKATRLGEAIGQFLG